MSNANQGLKFIIVSNIVTKTQRHKVSQRNTIIYTKYLSVS
jgi:hypothetical protein